MKKPIRTVVLELLREGDPHNQLLSPYTRYLGRCGDSNTASVTVPYEHKVFQDFQRRLRYEGATSDSSEVRQHVIDIVGRDMACLLASVPGFVSELNGRRDALIHLELDLWPAEVACLPFELAKMPRESPGGQEFWLALQPRVPVTITRRLRGQTGEGLIWPQTPRVLFVWSDAGGHVPHGEHLAALLHALMPWKFPQQETADRQAADETDGSLTILENADLPAIQDAVGTGSYTHVHILAHGASSEDGYDFGKLVLGTRRRPCKVDGNGLATALCPATKSDHERPCVVTLASCDSGAVASILGPGGSLAHFLHVAGIPLVIGSQFPLSKSGSVWMTKALYAGLFHGTDPRLLLHTIRERLFAAHGSETHDWASVICYAALPPDIDGQLEQVRLARCRSEIDARIGKLDGALDESTDPASLLPDLDAIRRCAGRYPMTGPFSGEGLGNAASAHKRLAEIGFRMAGDQDGDRVKSSIASLRDASRLYRKATHVFMLPAERSTQRVATLHWVLTQWLSLQAVLGRGLKRDLWTAAVVSAQMEMEASGGIWPLGSLLELELIGLDKKRQKSKGGAKRALDFTQQFIGKLPDSDGFEVLSTHRQISRYVNWWGSDVFAQGLGKQGISRQERWNAPGGLVETAKNILALLRPE